MLVGHLLRDVSRRTPQKLALVDENFRLTYSEFDRRVNQLANGLLGLDLNPGAKVAILSSNRSQYAIAFFALARTNYVSVHCSIRSAADELTYVLGKTGVDLLLTERSCLPLARESVLQTDRPIPIILLDRADYRDADDSAFRCIDDLMLDQSSAEPPQEFDATQPLAITLTGGTTGYPKAVLVTHRARLVTSDIASREFGLTGDDIILASTPLFHTVGLFVWFATAVMIGATAVLQKRWNPANFADLVEREGITAAFLVPSQLNSLVSDPEFDIKRLNSLRKIGYAGAPMGRALFDRVQSALPFVAFTENYGQSEACPITVRAPEETDKIGTVGRPATGVEICVVDALGQSVPKGEVGDVATRGEHVFSEYFGNPVETADAFRLQNGWLLTGDLGYLDDDGYLTLVDRSKDMLISGGENIYPAEIENVLYQHNAVAECAVVGIPDTHWGEVPAAFVVVAHGCEVSEQELVEFCAKSIARFKRPKLVAFVDSLPKTTVGKIRKNVLREPYWAKAEKKI